MRQSNLDTIFLKLIEEVGELSESIRNGKSGQPTLDELKGSIADVLCLCFSQYSRCKP